MNDQGKHSQGKPVSVKGKVSDAEWQTRIDLAAAYRLVAAYGWDDPIALINDFEADLQQALRNHQQAGRTCAIKVFEEEVSWMRQRAQELRLAFQ